MFDKHLSGDDLATAPKFCVADNGTSSWAYQGMKMPAVGLNAVVGRPLEEYGMEPTALEQLREGCYDVHARTGDMNANAIPASLNFGRSSRLARRRYPQRPHQAKPTPHLRPSNNDPTQ